MAQASLAPLINCACFVHLEEVEREGAKKEREKIRFLSTSIGLSLIFDLNPNLTKKNSLSTLLTYSGHHRHLQ